MDTLEYTRLIVIAGYGITSALGFLIFRKISLTTHKVGVFAASTIALLWASFYTWLAIISPLDANEVSVASLISRLIHGPVIVALFIMLTTIREQAKLVESADIDYEK